MTPALDEAAGAPVLDLLDAFRPFDDVASASDPIGWPGYPAALEAAAQRFGRRVGVLAGTATVGTQRCVAAAFDFRFFGGSLGAAEGAALVAAVRRAIQLNLPFVSVVASGGVRMQEGVVALTQMRRVAAALVELAGAHVPHVSVALHPTTGGVWSSLVAAADYVIAEREAQVCFSGSRVRAAPADTPEGSPFTAESQHAHGFVDAVCDRADLPTLLTEVLSLLAPATRGEPAPPDLPLAPAPADPPQTGWAQVQRVRADPRRRAEGYLQRYFARRVDIAGDRVGGRDDTVVCGFGHRAGRTVAFAAQTGLPVTAAGLRTTGRIVRTADRLRLPVLTLIDSPGPANGPDAEAAGVGTALADLLQVFAVAQVPVRSVVIGQGGSGGAMALSSDDLWMSPDSYYAVIAPESAAAILKRAPDEVADVAALLHLGPRELVEQSVARGLLAAEAEHGSPRR